MLDIQTMLNASHPYVPLYKQAYQIIRDLPPDQQMIVHAKITLEPTSDKHCYNLPTAPEVAAIIPGTGDEDVDQHREIILRLKAAAQGGSLPRISHLNPLYAPLHYVLLFSNGELGWHSEIASLPGPNGQVRTKYVTQ
jgi:hypothetical protein